MKTNKLILTLALAWGCAGTLAAQDLIVKTDASQVEARVLEISPEQIRYKRFSNPDGPTYVLPTNEIDYIRYANGETERFRPAQPAPVPPARPLTPEEEELARTPQTLPANPPYPVMPVPTQQPEAQHDPAQTPQTLPMDPPQYVMPVPQQPEAQRDPAQTPQTLPMDPPQYVMPAPQQPETVAQETVTGYAPAPYVRRYEIGEYYDENGVQGIVCALNEDQTHGLILSLQESYLRWSEFEKGNLRTIGTNDLSDGLLNMERVAAYIAENGASWEDFPAFKWCRDLGEGWYLPAINEVLTIGNNFNGGSRQKYDRQARTRFNDALKNHNGSVLSRKMFYFSSTEKNEKAALTSHMEMDPPYVEDIQKNTKYKVRAVRRF